MKTILIMALSLLILCNTSALFGFDFFKGTIEEALEKAKAENKRVFIYATMPECPACAAQEERIFSNDSVIAILGNYIVLKMDLDVYIQRYGTGKYIILKKTVPKRLVRRVKKDAAWNTIFRIADENDATLRRIFGQQRTPSDIHKMADIPTVAKSDNFVTDITAVKTTSKTVQKTPAAKMGIGIVAGTNLMKVMDDNYNRVGYNFGLAVPVRWSKNPFMINPTLAFVSKGGKISGSDVTIRANYVELSLPLMYTFGRGGIYEWGVPNGFKVFASPYYAQAVNASKHDLRAFDYGVKCGLSTFIGAGISQLELSIGYDFGLNNISKNTVYNMYNRGFFVTLALSQFAF